jgi:hypothetical protein
MTSNFSLLVYISALILASNLAVNSSFVFFSVLSALAWLFSIYYLISFRFMSALASILASISAWLVPILVSISYLTPVFAWLASILASRRSIIC